MNRIEKVFANKQKKKVLIPYIVGGFPNRDKSLRLMHTLAKNGADIIELGVPFSDPMADGPIIQNAIKVALENNINLIDILNLVKEFRLDNTFTPVILMGYLNPIYKMGYVNFASYTKECGVDGVLTVDCPFEYIQDLRNCLYEHAIDCIFLISPNTSIVRIKQILKFASGFIYYISLKGVTGSKELDLLQVQNKIFQLKPLINIPIVVGFGIKDIQEVRKIHTFADGVVIGSYIVDVISKNQHQEEQVISNIIQEFCNIF